MSDPAVWMPFAITLPLAVVMVFVIKWILEDDCDDE